MVKGNYQHLENQVELISKQSISMEQFFVQVFEMLLDHSSMLLNTFKLFMNDEIDPGSELLLSGHGNFGHPGIDFALIKMRSDYPLLDETELFFCRKNLFFIVCHSALALSCPVLKKAFNGS